MPEVIVIGAGPAGLAAARHIPAWPERDHYAIAGAVLAGCGSARPAAGPPAPAPGGLHAVSATGARTYLGTVTGTGAFIGIVLGGGHARAYVCDCIPRSVGTVADWFTGPVANGLLIATSRQHHLRLTARLGSQDAAGTLSLPGAQTASFTIAVPVIRREAGIFAGTARWRGRSYQAGWIVLPGGRQRGGAFFPTGPVKGLMIAVSDYPASLV